MGICTLRAGFASAGLCPALAARAGPPAATPSASKSPTPPRILLIGFISYSLPEGLAPLLYRNSSWTAAGSKSFSPHNCPKSRGRAPGQCYIFFHLHAPRFVEILPVKRRLEANP